MKLARKTDWNGGRLSFLQRTKKRKINTKEYPIFLLLAQSFCFTFKKISYSSVFQLSCVTQIKGPAVTKLFQTLATSNAIPGFRLFDVESQKLKVLVSHHFRRAGISENTRRAIGISFEYHHENIACSDIHALALIFESFLDG